MTSSDSQSSLAQLHRVMKAAIDKRLEELTLYAFGSSSLGEGTTPSSTQSSSDSQALTSEKLREILRAFPPKPKKVKLYVSKYVPMDEDQIYKFPVPPEYSLCIDAEYDEVWVTSLITFEKLQQKLNGVMPPWIDVRMPPEEEK